MTRAALLLLLLAGTLLATPVLPAAELEVERVELSVQLDPEAQALYATARLFLRNPGHPALDILDFTVPAPLGERFDCRSVWVRKGELAWRLDPVEDSAAARLRVALLSPLKAGKKLVIGVSYEVDLEGLSPPDAPASVAPHNARLSTTGWYPLPAGTGSATPERLRLAVRLPKDWRVNAPVKVKRITDGSALASYEVELKHFAPGQLLVGATPPP